MENKKTKVFAQSSILENAIDIFAIFVYYMCEMANMSGAVADVDFSKISRNFMDL